MVVSGLLIRLFQLRPETAAKFCVRALLFRSTTPTNLMCHAAEEVHVICLQPPSPQSSTTEFGLWYLRRWYHSYSSTDATHNIAKHQNNNVSLLPPESPLKQLSSLSIADFRNNADFLTRNDTRSSSRPPFLSNSTKAMATQQHATTSDSRIPTAASSWDKNVLESLHAEYKKNECTEFKFDGLRMSSEFMNGASKSFSANCRH